MKDHIDPAEGFLDGFHLRWGDLVVRIGKDAYAHSLLV